MDITPHIAAKSDQLNADDLIAGPVTVQITHVQPGSKEQPVTIRITGGHQPWKPSKTALRCLAFAWGPDSPAWVGRWATLYRDPGVKWAGKEVGGIRVQALSDIDRPITLSLAASRGKKQQHKIAVLRRPTQSGAPTANLDTLLSDAGLTTEDVDRWRATQDRGPVATLTAEQRAEFAAWLGADTARLDAIRALVPEEGQ